MPDLSPATLETAIHRLQEMTQTWERLFPQAKGSAPHWLKVLSQVQSHLREDCLRVAVVGTVKSGKSTLVNALLGQDLLKRGAGILTAMLTRVQPAEEPKAVLQFKDWSEIAAEIHLALGLFPSARFHERGGPLDLRQAADREWLAELLAEGETGDFWAGGNLNQDYLVLQAYLQGYSRLADHLAQGPVLSLNGAELAAHQNLVTQEASAVYLKDVLLNVPTSWLDIGVELGDCQGSDSPAPQHLTQVLAYLLKTDLLLYVISSRIGLRQADFLFLAELKKMGLLPHIRFLINLDLTEHQSLGDIQGITQRLQQELAPLLPQPSLYAFSALQLLLERRRQRGEILPEREEALLAVWATDPQIQSFSAGEAQRFTVELGHLLQELRHRRLMGSSLSQVATVAQGFKEQLALVQELLGKDLASFQDLEGRFQQRRQPLRATLESLRLTLRGVESNLQKKIKKRIDSYFDRHSRQGASLYTFIQQYEPNWQEVAPQEAAEPLRLALFRLFQEFQKELGRFAASVFNLQAMEFIRNQELWLRERLAETGAPLFLSLEEALSLYYRDLGTVGLSVSPPTLRVDLPPPPPELTAPLLQVQFDPGWRWASETWVRAGAGWLRRSWLKVKARLGFQAETDPRRQLLQELAYALKAMKRWLQEESHSLLLDYRERLKFRYFFPLLAYWLKRQESDLENLMGSLLADFEGLADIMRQEERQREVKRREVQELMAAVVEVSSLLEREA